MWSSSHCTVSWVSLLSSTSAGVFFTGRCGVISMNSPSDWKRPRTSWQTKM